MRYARPVAAPPTGCCERTYAPRSYVFKISMRMSFGHSES
jgi:hypothetical protein